MMLPEEIRMQLAFAFSPKRAIYNPITGFINKRVELEESVYLLTYKLLGILPSIKDNKVELTKEDIRKNDLKMDDRFDYGKYNKMGVR